MAAVIMEHRGKQLGEEVLERMIAELEAMSEDEAERRLARATPLECWSIRATAG